MQKISCHSALYLRVVLIFHTWFCWWWKHLSASGTNASSTIQHDCHRSSRVSTTIALWIFATVIVLPRFWMASKWHFIPIALGVLIFFVIVISVWKIFRIVRKHQQQIKGQTKAVSHLPANTVNILKCRKSAVTVLYIYGLFLIFYLPFMVSLLIKKFVGYTRTVRIVYEYAATAVFINSCLNPVVYCWRIGEIRRAVKNFVRRSIREWQVCLFTKLSCVLNRYERQTINALFARVEC